MKLKKGVIVQTASSGAPSGHINSVQNHGGRLQKTKQYICNRGKRGCDAGSCPSPPHRRGARSRAHLGTGCAIRLEIGCSRRGIPLAEKSTTRQRRDVPVGDQMLPISLTKSSSSFLVSAYFLAISSYLDSHWSRDCSRAWTLRS